MVIWTPEQWEKELNEFVTAVHTRKFNRIPYKDWQTLFGFTKLNPSEKIVLAIDSTGKMTLTPSNRQFNMNCFALFTLKS